MPNLSAISNETLLGKLLRAPLRLIPSRTVLPILQGPLKGKKWTAGSATHGCWLGSYEYEKQKALQAELKSGDVVYDIGANVGFYTLLASVLIGSTGHVYSFEPFPDNVEELRRHLQLNRIVNCTVLPLAVSSTNGEAAFDPSGDRCTGRLAATGELRVRTISLDSFVPSEHLPAPNLIKIDIEGAEYECLRGAAGIIENFRPTIFLATHGPEVHAACVELLREWRYGIYSADDRSVAETDELLAKPAPAPVKGA